ncbi:GNAT family N-acetyltransferase [Kribbella deserti]|uniref:GNAT family N-acetyltransferase n=1 Tax=Kribbella deserti TaxID=1926257 RepID=A0ABV6QRL9_9ACTN
MELRQEAVRLRLGKTDFSWTVEYDGRDAGTIDLTPTGGLGGDLRFNLLPAAGVQALRLVTAFAFERLGWEILVWRSPAGRWDAMRTAWEAGFGQFTYVDGGTAYEGVRCEEWLATRRSKDPAEPRTPWWQIPVIETERFRMRPHGPSDLERIVEAASDERTQYWAPHFASPFTRADGETYLDARLWMSATGTAISWAIADPDTDVLLANLSVLHLEGDDSGEIGFWAHPEARGRGLMTEAVGLAIRHAFTPVAEGGLGRYRLVLATARGNTASRHVAEANGFVAAGIEREAEVMRDGTRQDMVWFDLLRSESPFPSP